MFPPTAAACFSSVVRHPRSPFWRQGRLTASGCVRPRLRRESSQNLWPVSDIISIASRSMELRPGDLTMTGTPENVGPIQRGDTVTGGTEGIGEIRLHVA
ncbi:fumarylacetoacetate hydrolase family protein [Muricoccus aerilatus]|uniref:fumarylacetoacetate hydrolase family protein n=1 Tax=Muricoccus aerilatus TaxID=452982 RepID=UPI0009FEFF76|nr:fumarylacetoacetate hydrolase family protein [Roseomonas aerilata]